MIKQSIETKDAPLPNGAYSQALQIDSIIYTAGQLPIDPINNKLVTGGIIEQTHQVFSNLKAVLKKAGTDLSDVIKVTIYISDMKAWGEIDKIYQSYFTGEVLPARSIVGVKELHFDALIELEAIASKQSITS